MDLNKSTVLGRIGYSVRKTCGTCDRATFPNDDWGTCSRWQYEHQKHAGGDKGTNRDLSVNKSGFCPEYAPSLVKISRLGHFADFAETGMRSKRPIGDL